MSNEPARSFTGRQRSRVTRQSVILADAAARVVITLGGLGTILAVLLVCFFLLWVVWPLFQPDAMEWERSLALGAAGGHPATAEPGGAEERPAPSLLSPDEYLSLGWVLSEDSSIRLFRLDSGHLVQKLDPFAGNRPQAWRVDRHSGKAIFAFEGGQLRLGKLSYGTRFLNQEELPAEVQQLPLGAFALHDNGLVERTPEGQFRLQSLDLTLEEPIALGHPAPVRLIDQSLQTSGETFAALSEGGLLSIARVARTKNLLTGKTTARLTKGTLQLELQSPPAFLGLSGLGTQVYAAWPDGRLWRIDARNISQPVVAERLQVVAPDRTLTAMGFLVGKTSLVIGDSAGEVSIWFPTKPEDAETVDGSLLLPAHRFAATGSAVKFLSPSLRSRLLAVGHADDSVQLFEVTSEQQLDRVRLPPDTAGLSAVVIAPKDDALLALGGNQLAIYQIDAPHPETTWASLFLPVWYEGYPRRETVWQSSSGTDDFEPKYGLWPLVFGTLKATFYTMLFGGPLALLAAIYTSEFLHKRIKAKVKPTIEVMASLPSVVLGFLAGVVFAPLVEDLVPEILSTFVAVPCALLFAAQLWQLIPARYASFARRFRLLGVAVVLPLGIWAGFAAGPSLERWLFAGNMRLWLDGQLGKGWSGWLLIFLPLAALATAMLFGLFVNPALRRRAGSWSRTRFALLDLGKFFVGCLATLLMAVLVSLVLDGLGWDPRGSLLDTYEQRNAFIVGIFMGFAVIPIIYTIADDALTAVPDSLRAASLGTGATPWQTAVRVVIPTATSGLFSALMIGLGRAVGETMIVVMATGNTPVKSLNVFDGFRTLSANIATELPEAVQNSTHYRVLFLTALTLFMVTFFVNTAAEVVRQRFRKRAMQL